MSLFNILNNYNNINNQKPTNQINSDYPEVFYTNNYKQPQQSQTMQINNQSNNSKSVFGISKDMIGQFLPLLFGKGGTANNNFLSTLLQNGLKPENNNILSGLLGGNNNISEIFSILNQQNNKANNKKDMPNIIDMSDYKEIKS